MVRPRRPSILVNTPHINNGSRISPEPFFIFRQIDVITISDEIETQFWMSGNRPCGMCSGLEGERKIRPVIACLGRICMFCVIRLLMRDDAGTIVFLAVIAQACSDGYRAAIATVARTDAFC